MADVRVVHWNPRTPLFGRSKRERLCFGPRVGNFGDLLGPLIVERLLEKLDLDKAPPAGRSKRLLAVGSIAHLAKNGDTVWGSGVNGHKLADRYATDLDIRALRGPLSRAFLLEKGLAKIPEVYGDPGLLLGQLEPWLLNVSRHDSVVYVPNLNDRPHALPTSQSNLVVLDPRAPLETCLKTIASGSFVVGSSLHAIIVAESLGIGARCVQSDAEGDFKYRDYYAGTGRDFAPAESVSEAISAGAVLPPRWDESQLISAFPRDLWKSERYGSAR
jgi:pyruvyltransferase